MTLYRGTLTARLLHALRNGAANTSRELAIIIDHPRKNVSTILSGLADRGLVIRGVAAPTLRGRPCIRWRAAQ